MQCPKPECGYQGFVESGICPKCGQKLLPSVKFYDMKEKPPSILYRVSHFVMQVVFRALESALCSVGFYFLFKLFVLLYNGLCQEIPEWIPIDVEAAWVRYFLWGAYALTTYLVFKSRWRSL